MKHQLHIPSRPEQKQSEGPNNRDLLREYKIFANLCLKLYCTATQQLYCLFLSVDSSVVSSTCFQYVQSCEKCTNVYFEHLSIIVPICICKYKTGFKTAYSYIMCVMLAMKYCIVCVLFIFRIVAIVEFAFNYPSITQETGAIAATAHNS